MSKSLKQAVQICTAHHILVLFRPSQVKKTHADFRLKEHAQKRARVPSAGLNHRSLHGTKLGEGQTEDCDSSLHPCCETAEQVKGKGSSSFQECVLVRMCCQDPTPPCAVICCRSGPGTSRRRSLVEQRSGPTMKPSCTFPRKLLKQEKREAGF